MTGYAWLFAVAWVVTTVVAWGYWYEVTYLRATLDKLIHALHLIMDEDDENKTE